MNLMDRNQSMARLRERVKKIDVRDAIEKIIDRAELEIEAIRSSSEFKLAERTGNAFVYEDELAEIRTRAMAAVAKLAAETESELEYLGQTIDENRGAGSVSAVIGEETAQRGWARASLLLQAGIAAASVVKLAVAEADREMLAGLERNISTYIHAAAGDRFDEASVRRSIATVRAEIEAATDSMMDEAGAAYREAAREFEQRDTAAVSWIRYGHKAAAGRATAGDPRARVRDRRRANGTDGREAEQRLAGRCERRAGADARRRRDRHNRMRTMRRSLERLRAAIGRAREVIRA